VLGLRLVIASPLHAQGRRLFDGGTQRLSVIRNVTSPSGYLLVDLAVAG
jgi:hypothetical protein